MNRRVPTPAQFVNRELGILAFNRRVLAMAADDAVPLLERLRFITIVSSNLDEFFEIRVAGLKESIKLGLPEPGPDARPAAEVFDAVSREAHALVAGMTVLGSYQFRVTRNSDLFVDEEEIKNLHTAVQGELLHRHFGDAVRLELADNCSERMSEFLLQQFGLQEADLYRVEGPVNLYRLREVPDQVERADLKYPPFQPGLAPTVDTEDLFGVLKKQDVLLHHPFQSFLPVIDFIRATANDPSVIAIKQTVYRTGTDSELMEILVEAARKGKEVTVVVELMARFDEEINMNWAARLEEVGAHVVYGVVGHKTHAKMSLIVRREDTEHGKALRRYAHLGTGNYHPATARQYTDFGLFSAHEELCADVAEVFQQLTGLGRAVRLKHVWQSPFTLHRRLIAAIRNEAKLAAEGKPARIIAKMNALLEPQIIEELYTASGAGVKIDLLVRGVCALRPGIEGVSENIRVRSVVGRFLEHSRVFYFENGGAEDVYLASADWMARNFFRRIELCFPVLDPALKKRVIREGLQPYLEDNSQAWVMGPDGNYERLRPRRGAKGRSAQEELLLMLATPS